MRTKLEKLNPLSSLHLHGWLTLLLTSLPFTAGAIICHEASTPNKSHIATLPAYGRIDLSGIVIVRSPYGVISSGVLLSSRKHILTAAHVVKESLDDSRRPLARVEFYGKKSLSLAWQKVTIHPSYKKIGDPWDAAIIELPETIAADIATGHQLVTQSPLGKTIIKCGWGRTGSPQQGESQPSGTRTVGLNRYDERVAGDTAKRFGFLTKNTPLLTYDFDDGTAATSQFGADLGAGIYEAHVGNGDSGGPALLRDAAGAWRIAAINIGRKSTPSDPDGHTNGSIGEVGFDLDASRIAAWVTQTISPNNAK